MAEAGCLRDNVAVQNLEVLGQATIAGTIEKPSGANGGILNPSDIAIGHARTIDAAAGATTHANTDLKIKCIDAWRNLPTLVNAATSVDVNYAKRLNECFGSTLTVADTIGTGAATATVNQVKELVITADVIAARVQDGARTAGQFQVYRITGDAEANNIIITLPAATVGQSLVFIFAADAVLPDQGNTLRFRAPSAVDSDSFIIASAGANHHGSVVMTDKQAAGNADLVFTPGADGRAPGAGLQNGFVACTCSVAGTWHIAAVFGTLDNVVVAFA